MAVSCLAFMIFKCLIQRTEFFVGNQSLQLTNLPISQGDWIFQEEKKMLIFFLLVYLLEQPNATHLLTIFVKLNITKNLKNLMLKCN